MTSHGQIGERRKHQRVSNNVPLKISFEDGDVVTETYNISRAGAYCRVDKFIEPMIKLRVNLLLPFKKEGKNNQRKISCEGVVVRSEAVPGKDYFNIAIFFNDISQRDAECLSDYVEHHTE